MAKLWPLHLTSWPPFTRVYSPLLKRKFLLTVVGHFGSFSPSCMPIFLKHNLQNPTPWGQFTILMQNTVSKPSLNFSNYLTIFYNFSFERLPALLRPFQDCQFSFSRLEYLSTNPFDLTNDQVQSQAETWRHILTCRHILVGCSISSTKMFSCSFETYCPN